ncbi:B12-binding domain-containing radical SAM protein [Candidatus Omnitrophota bacterium]
MRIIFAYKGRYQIRDSVIIEHLSAIAKKYGHDTGLIYDQDVFGVTDNVANVPFLNRILSDEKRFARKAAGMAPDMIVFLEGFARGRWNDAISKIMKELSPSSIRVRLSRREAPSPSGLYDHTVTGEAEFAFECFLADKLYSGNIRAHDLRGLADLNALPLPDKSLFAPYINFTDSYLIYTSKGCPYECSYCEETVYKNNFGAGYFRRKDPENVIRELAAAKAAFKIKEVMYKDSVFARDKGWLKKYLKLYRENIDLPYKCFGKAESFDDELAAMLKETKCYCVEFGVQTFNEKLKNDMLKRDEKTSALLRAFSACDSHALRYDADHIFGIPGESIPDHIEAAGIYAGLRYMNRIKCHNLVYYKEADIYEYAPPSVKGDSGYREDFFSHVSGGEAMVGPNRAFEKFFKALPALPKWLVRYIAARNRWKIFSFVPHIAILPLMLALAVKNKDRRFMVYLKYYPKKIRMALR